MKAINLILAVGIVLALIAQNDTVTIIGMVLFTICAMYTVLRSLNKFVESLPDEDRIA